MTAVGGVCPECGTQKTVAALSPLQHFERDAIAARERLEDGWRLWARTLFASPLIFFAQFGACLGPVLLVAFAFIGPFRIFALRRMIPIEPYADRLPEMERDIRRSHALAGIECGLSVVVVLVALVQSLPTPLLPGWSYLCLAILIALWQCITLLQAHRLARTTPPLLVDSSRLPRTSNAWIVIPCLLSVLLYLGALGAVATAEWTRTDAWFAAAWACWFVAAISLSIAAVWSRAHAMLVCDCLFEAQLFQERRRPGSFFHAQDGEVAIRSVPRPKHNDDDAPIPLADEVLPLPSVTMDPSPLRANQDE